MIPMLFSLPVYPGHLRNVYSYFKMQNKWCPPRCDSVILFFYPILVVDCRCFMTLLPAVCKERGSVSLVPSSARGRGLLMLDTVKCILHSREIVPSTSVPAISLHMFSPLTKYWVVRGCFLSSSFMGLCTHHGIGRGWKLEFRMLRRR